jgi:hypothetical protein
MLMLHMIRNYHMKNIPVIFFKQPYFQRKFAFGDRQAHDMELELHSNIPPIGVSVSSRNGKSELVQHFGIGKTSLMMPLGKQDIAKHPERWLCATDTIMKGPFGTFNWPWDVVFCGHKSSDYDPVLGEVPLSVDIHQIEGSAHLAYPLRSFTDDDVWRLTKAWDIPINRLRYGSAEERKSDTNDVFNEDYFPYCHKCCDPNEDAFVTCPKSGLQITNISASLPKSPNNQLAYCSKD